jgi:hypothetical protein
MVPSVARIRLVELFHDRIAQIQTQHQPAAGFAPDRAFDKNHSFPRSENSSPEILAHRIADSPDPFGFVIAAKIDFRKRHAECRRLIADDVLYLVPVFRFRRELIHGNGCPFVQVSAGLGNSTSGTRMPRSSYFRIPFHRFRVISADCNLNEGIIPH